MKYTLTTALLFAVILVSAQNNTIDQRKAGTFSLGTRNTISMFNDDEGVGKGIGGQFRIQISDRLNTEWYFDYITARNPPYTYRNDYHIGWSVMYYFTHQYSFDRFLQPYFIVGHCFDYSKVMQQNNKANYADRLSMATQAGIGTHLNINDKLDCSLSGQYMLHFGKEIVPIAIGTDIKGEQVLIEQKSFTHPHGHLLFTVSFNYKLFHLWR